MSISTYKHSRDDQKKRMDKSSSIKNLKKLEPSASHKTIGNADPNKILERTAQEKSHDFTPIEDSNG